MKVVTVATDPTNVFLSQLLYPSCDSLGLDLVVLCPRGRSFRFADKRTVLATYLSSIDDRDEIIVFTDAYDTLFIRGPEHIEAAYAHLSQRVVFSGELNSWPLGAIGMALQEEPPAGRYPYLNSGGFIGPAGDILDLCTKYPAPPDDRFEILVRLRQHGYDTAQQFDWSDQYHWTLVRLLERESIGIDHNATLFECFGPPFPDLVYREVMREVNDFELHGIHSGAYQRERERLPIALATPSGAAQIHFAGSVTKAAALELYRDGLLPDWLGKAGQPEHPNAEAVPVVRM